jgi:hypothetical protein
MTNDQPVENDAWDEEFERWFLLRGGGESESEYFISVKDMLLKSTDELPDLPKQSQPIKLQWDIETRDDKSTWNVIRADSVILWQQPAFYEGFKEFARVAELLLLKYGSAICDLKPTTAADSYLLGDSWSAESAIEKARRRVGFKRFPWFMSGRIQD